MSAHRILLLSFFAWTWLQAPLLLWAQDYGTRLGMQRGGELSYAPQGPGVLFGALDPAVKKWYVPQELYLEYGWKQSAYTNYARDHYKTYVNIGLEGDYFYDLYGRFVTHGWLIYDWSQSQPQLQGSAVAKAARFSSWFNKVLISSDQKGQYHYAATIGERIRTTLTPLTFSKPSFDGIQWDFLSDKYALTVLASRPSQTGDVLNANRPTPTQLTDVVNLMGMRGTVQVGDFVTLGTTYVSGFNTQTLGQTFKDSPFHGSLTTEQNKSPSRIEIRLSDDSPGDGEAGTAFFAEEIIIEDKEGNVFRGRDLGFEPLVRGGIQREGFLAADGNEQIVLEYDLESSAYRQTGGPDPSQIKSVKFRLLLANDYRIDMTSNVQTDLQRKPVLLSDGIPQWTVHADGNVKDSSNQRFVVLDYGLPTANEIFGFTVEATDVGGVYLYAEFDRNRRHSRYPNRSTLKPSQHHRIVESADAWMMNLWKKAYPWFFLGEAYSMEPSYATSIYLPRGGIIDYSRANLNRYDFVDDNDDQDRNPDWERANQPVDIAVFPGFDENNDFVPDFNQNDSENRPNLFPDYEEPFLRFSSDRPEFLFGVDMNNNGTVDRFENDDEADFPYKRGRRGFNFYTGVHLAPGLRLSVGHMREELISDDRQNHTYYSMAVLDWEHSRWGKLLLYHNIRRAEDNIPDDLIQWSQPSGSSGQLVPFIDPLPARGTWINTFYTQWDYRDIPNLNVVNKLKYEIFRQRDYLEGSDIAQTGRRTSGFFGLINKADYLFRMEKFTLVPRWKSEFYSQRPFLKADNTRRELTESASLLLTFSMLTATDIEAGLELLHFEQLREKLEEDPFLSDREEVVLALQTSNTSAYLGYATTTQAGIRLSWVDRASDRESERESVIFITMYAGLD